MKLVTFDAGRVGRLDGEGDDAVVVELDCASTREWFERGGLAGETGERLPLAQVQSRSLALRPSLPPIKRWRSARPLAAGR